MTPPATRHQVHGRRLRRGILAAACALALVGATLAQEVPEDGGPARGEEQESAAAPQADATPRAAPAAPAGRTEAKVRVSGLWLIENRKMRELLTVLEPEGRPLPVLDAAFIEDAVLVLQSALSDRGFLKSTGAVRLTLADGSERTISWAAGEVPILPRGLAATEADFKLEPGVLYFIDELEIEGLQSLAVDQARAYFVNEGFVLGGRAARKYTPDGVERGAENLRVQLNRVGRVDASVSAKEVARDDRTGAVAVRVAVDEGPLHRIGAVEVRGEVPEEARVQVQTRVASATGAVYSPLRRQDLLQQIHVDLYGHGYAEARVHLTEESVATAGEEVMHTLLLELEAGPLVRVGEVNFAGENLPRQSVLRRATDVRTGQIFDRNRIEQDRLGLSNLGAFAAVRADVEPRSPDVWDLTYLLRPSKRLEVGLLAGYGSYERLRGGIEVFHANQLGRAERGRLQLVESTKSTSADYQLMIPQIFGTTTNGSVRAFGLDREEVSFDRREAGVSAGARRHSERFGVDLAVRYQYESLRAENVVPDLQETAPEDSQVGAVTFDISLDRRDNPLSPKSGYDFSFALETAGQPIGSEVDYQKLDLKLSWHGRVAQGLTIHLGLRHGSIWTFGGSSRDIPINKRFFPGGESTIRGYSEGKAAPRGETGEIIGAEVSTMANVELELALLANLSAVVFVDTGVTGTTINDFPGDDLRVSTGLGLRYNSLIGPVRVEYGHNVVRESGDQSGQLHLSLGFPF